MHRWHKRGAFVLGVAVVIATASFVYYQHHYPYGYSHCCDKHCCDKVLYLELCWYAEMHNGYFSTGEDTPEASLSLLYLQEPGLVDTLRGKTVPKSIVRARLESGQRLTPETCGWHYNEGLRIDDDPRLALFWDKAGLSHNGGRLSPGAHLVYLVAGDTEYISGERWQQFLADQEQLLAKVKRPPIEFRSK